MRRFFILAGFILLTKTTIGQNLNTNLITTAGDYFSSQNNSLSWTIGEPFTETVQSTNNILTQGFQQKQDLISNSIFELDKIISVNCFPNPIKEYLTLESNSTENLTYQILNINGNIVLENKFCESTIIDFKPIMVGIYILNIYSSTLKKIHSFKIQKISF